MEEEEEETALFRLQVTGDTRRDALAPLAGLIWFEGNATVNMRVSGGYGNLQLRITLTITKMTH